MKRPNLQKIRRRVSDVLFAIIVIVILVIISGTARGKKPSLFGYEILRVLTSSMQPTIAENECIIIKKTSIENIEVGNIITFISQEEDIYGMYNTHRVVEIKEENDITYFVTKGDNNTDNDTKMVDSEHVVGKYVKKLPFGDVIGIAIAGLTNNKVYFLVIILPLMLCMVSYIFDIFHIANSEDEDVGKDNDNKEK